MGNQYKPLGIYTSDALLRKPKKLKLDPGAIVEFVRNEEEANAMDIMFARAVTSENAQEVIDNTPRYTCPDCGMISYHPKDIENHYCGNCHRFEIDRGQR